MGPETGRGEMGQWVDGTTTRPAVHFGDYPDGPYWSGERSSGAEEHSSADNAVSGDVIRLMWDYSVLVPLWDAEGLLPEEPRWLKEALGLSDSLIEALTSWGKDMNALDGAPRGRTRESYEALDARARVLARRLQAEVGSRHTVEYRPW